ncbi:UNVERIFIED_CONTAM: hypothetical protein Slati_2258100 [Sesamum latifolium]|uniref:Uncharacterized protein n=1 Tax=Sesamum latifolium TaxID=2727402 RepID=A0AAW2WTI6_9LAMI
MNATFSASLNRTLDAHSRGPGLGTFQTQSWAVDFMTTIQCAVQRLHGCSIWSVGFVVMYNRNINRYRMGTTNNMPKVTYPNNALSITSRYQACAGEAQWGAVKSILKYLKRTKDMFLIYDGAWKSSKQDTTADSTMKAKYIAASEAAKKAVWSFFSVASGGSFPRLSFFFGLYPALTRSLKALGSNPISVRIGDLKANGIGLHVI